MTVTENTPERLILDHVPWGLLASLLAFMSIWVAGAVVFVLSDMVGGAVVFLGLGTVLPMAIIWGMVQRNQLVFDRKAGTVEFRTRSFRGFTRHPYQLSMLQRAYVGKHGGNRGLLYLEIKGGMDAGHPSFPKAAAKLTSVVAAADAITAWLDT